MNEETKGILPIEGFRLLTEIRFRNCQRGDAVVWILLDRVSVSLRRFDFEISYRGGIAGHDVVSVSLRRFDFEIEAEAERDEREFLGFRLLTEIRFRN